MNYTLYRIWYKKPMGNNTYSAVFVEIEFKAWAGVGRYAEEINLAGMQVFKIEQISE